MSKENRKREYDRLVALGKLSQDDGALVKEFGEPKTKEEPKAEPKPEPIIIKKEEPKKKAKK